MVQFYHHQACALLFSQFNAFYFILIKSKLVYQELNYVYLRSARHPPYLRIMNAEINEHCIRYRIIRRGQKKYGNHIRQTGNDECHKSVTCVVCLRVSYLDEMISLKLCFLLSRWGKSFSASRASKQEKRWSNADQAATKWQTKKKVIRRKP